MHVLHVCCALHFQTTRDLFGRACVVWLPLQQLGVAFSPFNQTKQVEAAWTKVSAERQIRKSLGEEGVLPVSWIGYINTIPFLALV